MGSSGLLDSTLEGWRPMTFAHRIKHARMNLRLTQVEMNQKLGYKNNQFLQAWEAGRSMPPIRVLSTLSKVYVIPYHELVSLYVDEKLRQYRDKLMEGLSHYDN